MIQHFHETYEGSSVDLKIEKYIYVIYILHIMHIYIYIYIYIYIIMQQNLFQID